MRYFLFIDESGEVNSKKDDLHFNVFNLCGILIDEITYSNLEEKINLLKINSFGTKDIVFHSYDMRWKKKEFVKFLDKDFYFGFMEKMEEILRETDYEILSCVLLKEKYKEKYGDKVNFDYKTAIEFICERAGFIVNRQSGKRSIHVCIEKRERSQNRIVYKHYLDVIKNGNAHNEPKNTFRLFDEKLHFKAKNENIVGLQISDLCAYPIGHFCLYPEKKHKTYSVIENKIHQWKGRKIGCGLKIIPPPQSRIGYF